MEIIKLKIPLFFQKSGKEYLIFQVETRTKTSIRNAKENDRDKRERRRGRERNVEGEI